MAKGRRMGPAVTASLPPDCVAHIVRFLTGVQRLQAALIDRAWRAAARIERARHIQLNDQAQTGKGTRLDLTRMPRTSLPPWTSWSRVDVVEDTVAVRIWTERGSLPTGQPPLFLLLDLRSGSVDRRYSILHGPGLTRPSISLPRGCRIRDVDVQMVTFSRQGAPPRPV